MSASVPHTAFVALLALSFVVGFAWKSSANDDAGKQPIPDKAAQDRAVALVADIFKSDYQTAKTPEQKTALAKKMLDAVQQVADDPAGQYTLLRIAREIASQAGDWNTAEQASKAMVESFQVDELALLAETLATSAKAARDKPKLAAKALEAAEQAMERDRLAIARQMCAVALASANESRNPDLLQLARRRSEEVEYIDQAQQEIVKDLATLDANPTDPAANHRVGRYYGLVRGQWDKGLPMLALGDDPTLAAMAQAELRLPRDAMQQKELADRWWELSEQMTGHHAQRCKERAAYWYAQAVEKLDGLDKAIAERRISEARPSGLPASPAPSALVPQEVTVVRALFGVDSRQNDVTAIVQKSLREDPLAPIQADDRIMGDPASGVQKVLAITYRIGARTSTLRLGQSEVSPIPQLPPEGLRLPDASKALRILAARYGAGLTWIDVTDVVRRRTVDPATPHLYSQHVLIGQAADPWFGVPKTIAIWFDYQGKRYLRLVKEGETGALLP